MSNFILMFFSEDDDNESFIKEDEILSRLCIYRRKSYP